LQNNIEFEEDDEEEDRYVAKIRIKAETSNQITPTKQPQFQSRQKKKNSLANSRKNLDSVSSVQSISSKQSLKDFNSQQKENKKTPFVLASNQNGAKPTNKIAADYMSFRNKSPVETFSTYETQNENKSLFELMENIDITRDQNKTKNNFSSIQKGPNSIRSKSTQPTAKKMDSNSEEAGNQKKATSLIDEYLSGCIEEYKTFSKLMDFENITTSIRPKKLSLDALSKLIEEIWTARFTKETNILKANLSKGESTNRSYLSRQRNSSLSYFIYEFLKEKNKGSKNHQNMGLSLAYSTLLYKRKSERVNLFSRFLSEQSDNEDLTFFLFGRSLIEKELVLVLMNNKNLSNDGVGLSQKNCYRILEAIYGKEEKLLINRVFKKIKDQIEWEQEMNISSEVNKINMYSFLKIVLEDYHSSRLSIAADDQATDSVESNSTTRHEDNEAKISDKRRGSLHEEITQEEIKDEIEKYLFNQPAVEMPKALNDITNQTNTQDIPQNQSQIQGGLFSNIHSSWYNNPNPSFRNQIYGQFKDNNETVQSDHFNSNYLNTDYSRNNSLASLQSRTNNNQGRNNPQTVKSLPFNNIEEGDSSYSFEQNETSFSQYEKLNNSKVYHNSRSNSYSDLHRNGQQTSYAQLNNRKMNNTRNNSINEFPTNSDSGRNGNSSYSSRHNSKQNLLIAQEKKKLEKSFENQKSALSLKDKFASITQDPVVEKSHGVENFSFRNSDIQVHHPNLTNTSSDSERNKGDDSSSRYPNFQTNQTDNSDSQRSFIRNNNQSQGLKSFCLAVMTAKVHDFIDTMLFEGQEEKNEDEQKIMTGLMELFDRKFKDLLEALFNFDKLKWLSSLMIEDPDTKQLQNVEELQKELRGLQRKNFDDLDEGDIEIFANKIFRTPELSTQIGRLIVEFTLPQDLLYEDDS